MTLRITNPHYTESDQKRAYFLELSKEGTDAQGATVYERLVFAYDEKVAVGVTKEQIAEGVSEDVSIWADFYFNRGSEPIPPITDIEALIALIGGEDDGTLVIEQQLSPYTSEVPIGNWIPYVSPAEDWHLKTHDNDLSSRGRVRFVAEMQAPGNLVSPDLGTHAKQTFNMRMVVTNWDKFYPSEIDEKDPKMYNMFDFGAVELDFSNLYDAPSSALHHVGFAVATMISAVSLGLF